MVGTDVTVREDQDPGALVDRAAGVAEQGLERVVEQPPRRGATGARPREAHGQRLRLEVGHEVPAEAGDVVVGEDRMRQAEHAALAGRLLEEVALAADTRHQRHDRLLADGVDGRVRHLRELLLEVPVEELWPLREHRERDVHAHRAHRLLAAGRHRPEEHLEILLGVAEAELELADVARLERVGALLDLRRRDGGEIDAILLEPGAVRALRRDAVLDLLVGDHAARDGVDEEHAPGLHASLGVHARGVEIEDAGLAGHDHELVGDRPLRRPEPVAVEHRADEITVGEGDRRRAVPGLDQARVVLVEGALLGRHLAVVGERLGDEHHHHVR